MRKEVEAITATIREARLSGSVDVYGWGLLITLMTIMVLVVCIVGAAVTYREPVVREYSPTHLHVPVKFHPRLIRPEVRTNLVEEATWNLTNKTSFCS